MEELQIKNIVHRASTDEAFRQELVNNIDAVIEREGLSPRVAEVVTHLVPYLSMVAPRPILGPDFFGWWRA